MVLKRIEDAFAFLMKRYGYVKKQSDTETRTQNKQKYRTVAADEHREAAGEAQGDVGLVQEGTAWTPLPSNFGVPKTEHLSKTPGEFPTNKE